MSKFKNSYFCSRILVKYVAFALCHSQGFLCDESVASGAEQELALERHAISHSGSCGCAALRQKWNLLGIVKRISTTRLFCKMNEFHDWLQGITPNYSEGNFSLAVRAFACRRTNRGDNTVGSAVWRLARTTDGNQKWRIFIFHILLLLFSGFIFAHIENLT